MYLIARRFVVVSLALVIQLAACGPTATRRPTPAEEDAAAPAPMPLRDAASVNTPDARAGTDVSSAADTASASADGAVSAEPCPTVAFDFEKDLQGAMVMPSPAGPATLARDTGGGGCGTGSLKVNAAIGAASGDKVVITLPIPGDPLELNGKTIWCMFKQGTSTPETATVWLQALTDKGKFIEAWKMTPGAWKKGREKLVTAELQTRALSLWLTAGASGAWTGEVFIDHCGWR